MGIFKYWSEFFIIQQHMDCKEIFMSKILNYIKSIELVDKYIKVYLIQNFIF